MTATQQWRLALDAEYDSRRSVWSDIQGHLEFLHDQAAGVQGAKVLELGVRWGTSTAVLLAAVEKVGGHLWSVDLTPPSVPSWWALTGRWTLTIGDDLDPKVIEAQPDGVDMLLLDTSHIYQHTLAELRAYVPKIRPGGIFCCHDTELDNAPDQPPGDPSFPVARALDVFCEETGLVWENRSGSYGLGVIRIPA
jgi:cephalosporin hydroxylase